ncbi:DUF2807 domain-containing protein [Candidatus Synchoanobacter obligatus]|uniref:DUF2807 domain-containing protein n=1 Tax=Candidatus Synchoanobacter obligatus TaxID=2919597 RepID=A0ABT1L5G9_9GAMM|nr:DUF2807 domain-containing protein [Candidatus Synchoanobacter obligatus]MCP8352419.1 DUF2807 domain-containing protein [Candidatus Synchoanobacter obligatus]
MTVMKYSLAGLLSWSIAAVPTLAPESATEAPHTKTLSIDFEEIASLHVAGGYTVSISEGAPNVSLTGTEQALKQINITHEDNILSLSPLKSQQGFFTKLFNLRDEDSAQYRLTINITLPKLEALQLDNSSDAIINSDLGVNKLSISGSSSVKFTQPQTTRTMKLETFGTSTLNAIELKANTILLDLHDSSTVTIDTLNLRQSIKIDQSSDSKLFLKQAYGENLVLQGSSNSKQTIGKLGFDLAFFDLFLNNQCTIDSFKADSLNFKLRGNSRLVIQDGFAKSTKGITSGLAKYHFKAFKPGKTQIQAL